MTEFYLLFAFAVFGLPLLFLWVVLVFLGSFLVANFLTLEKREPLNVQITISEYLNYLVDRSSFLNKLSTKWDKDFVNEHYFGGCKYVSRF